MRRRLLDLLACPGCRGTLVLEVFREVVDEGCTPRRVACATVCGWRGAPVEVASPGIDDCARCYTRDVVEGVLRCGRCARAYPIVAGVPRMLAPALLHRLAARFPDFFADHPECLPALSVEEEPPQPLLDTFECFTRQRLDLGTPGRELAHQWAPHLERTLGPAIPLASLRDRLVLDVGCGFGRHLFVAARAGAESVGVDLSGGVDRARDNNADHPRCHLVQADIHDRPLCDDAFDVVWCIGVLHHLPDPHAGFRAIVPYLRSGGALAVWVYGYRGMAFTYRLSHMRTLVALLRRVPSALRVAASRVVATVLSALYWEPLRLASAAGLAALVARLPLADYVEHGWRARVAAVHDRLAVPLVHYHDREELLGWCRDAGLIDVVVEDTARRGWRAFGRRPPLAVAARSRRQPVTLPARAEDRA